MIMYDETGESPYYRQLQAELEAMSHEEHEAGLRKLKANFTAWLEREHGAFARDVDAA